MLDFWCLLIPQERDGMICHIMLLSSVRSLVWNNFLVHKLHLQYTVSLQWEVWCFLRSPGHLYDLSHKVQAKGFSPVWDLWCSFRFPERENDLLHNAQAWGFWFITQNTSVRFLSCVKSLMNFKVIWLREWFVTQSTSVGFLSSVRSLMYFKIPRVREWFVTQNTSVGFLSCVNS